MNIIKELWSKKLQELAFTPAVLEHARRVYDLRCIAYTVSSWATRQLFDAEPVCMARIVVRPRCVS